MTGNAFEDALNEAEDEQSTDDAELSTDEFLAGLGEGPKDETVGVAVPKHMKAVVDQLKNDTEVDVDVAQSVRDHFENLANRHPEAAERAKKKLEIDGEL
jgi:hypothetical protein